MIMIEITNNPYLKSLTPGSRAPTAADAFGKKNDLLSYLSWSLDILQSE